MPYKSNQTLMIFPYMYTNDYFNRTKLPKNMTNGTTIQICDKVPKNNYSKLSIVNRFSMSAFLKN